MTFNLSEEIEDVVMKDKISRLDIFEKRELARYTTCIKEIYYLFDTDEQVYFDIANNKNTPEEILVKLSRNFNWWVREAVKKNINTPQYIKDELELAEIKLKSEFRY